MDEARTLIFTLFEAYYQRHQGMIDGWYANRKMNKTSITEQKEIIFPPVVYDEIIVGFMSVMNFDISQRSKTIKGLYANNIFKLNSENYIVFVKEP